jgi:hypothetical protein
MHRRSANYGIALHDQYFGTLQVAIPNLDFGIVCIFESPRITYESRPFLLAEQ